MGFLKNYAVKRATLEVIQDADEYLSSAKSNNHNLQVSEYIDLLAERYSAVIDDELESNDPFRLLAHVLFQALRLKAPMLMMVDKDHDKHTSVFLKTISKNILERSIHRHLHDFAHCKLQRDRSQDNTTSSFDLLSEPTIFKEQDTENFNSAGDKRQISADKLAIEIINLVKTSQFRLRYNSFAKTFYGGQLLDTKIDRLFFAEYVYAHWSIALVLANSSFRRTNPQYNQNHLLSIYYSFLASKYQKHTIELITFRYNSYQAAFSHNDYPASLINLFQYHLEAALMNSPVNHAFTSEHQFVFSLNQTIEQKTACVTMLNEYQKAIVNWLDSIIIISADHDPI